MVFVIFYIINSTIYSSIAQSPERFSYQAIIRNTTNNIVSNQPVRIRISILQSSAAGASVYTETHTPTTDVNGLVTLEIGSVVVPDFGVFAGINWSAGPYFLKTEIDPAGGTSYTITGTSQFLSVPYALYAKTADYNNLSNKPVLDGSETKVVAGTSISVTGSGTIASPYQGSFHTQSLTEEQRDDIISPTAGQFIWCNNCGPSGETQVFNGTIWTNLTGGTTAPPFPPALGELYLGGVIAYLFVPGDLGYVVGETHGIIAALSDQSTGAEWGCTMGIPGADAQDIGTGAQNTIDIVNNCAEAGRAARICSEYINSNTGTGVFSDWFLPSNKELEKLYLNRAAIGNFNLTKSYWSSTEVLAAKAMSYHFGSAANQAVVKDELYNVRAIRYF